jgi:protein-ribulosamine 3-kinase
MHKSKLEEIIGESISSESTVGGGSIADSRIITTHSGKKLFLKQGFSNNMFANEANGLKELERANVIRIPHVIAVGKEYLILEHIEQGPRKQNFFKDFGHRFALLHQVNSEKFGFFENNFIGSTPQKNTPEGKEANDWSAFYWNKRLMFQFKLAESNGFANKQLRTLFADLENIYAQIIHGSEEPPALLHGDLWSGNYLSDESGNPVLIDPAVYYGHREADLAMTKLFGGFSSSFYETYNKAFPLKEGFEKREPLYLLYHVLNHMNLFGEIYRSQAVRLLESLTR